MGRKRETSGTRRRIGRRSASPPPGAPPGAPSATASGEPASSAEGAPAPPGGSAARAYRRRLGNLTNVRTALADVFRRLEADQLQPSKARAMVYTLQVLASAIQGTELEERIAALEDGRSS